MRLGEVIGQRNSILGKVAPASQRLFNDLVFLELAPVCIAQLQSKENDTLADKLTEAVNIKLEAANQMASLRREGRPLCFNGKPSNQGRILRRVVGKFFAGEVQAWLSRVNALHYDLLAPYQALEKHLNEAQTPAYRLWREQRDMQLAWLPSAPRQHVEMILPILKSCDLAPGSPIPETEG